MRGQFKHKFYRYNYFTVSLVICSLIIAYTLYSPLISEVLPFMKPLNDWYLESTYVSST